MIRIKLEMIMISSKIPLFIEVFLEKNYLFEADLTVDMDFIF